MYVDPEQGIRTEAFDHVKLAAELSRVSRVRYVHYNLPFDSFHYVPESDFSQIVFDVNGTSWKFDISTEEKEIIWHSEQDGWPHLYLCDGTTGEMKRQITKGPWVVREVKYVDELDRVIYFTGSCLEPGRDVYYRHLYKVGLDDNQIELLTPEDAEHQIIFTPSGKYFLDRYSRVDLAPSTVLRRCDSSLVLELETADLDLFFETGWSFPERFCVKARDGITDIYGMIVMLSNFDSSRIYPVIEANYSGPQTIRTPKAFGESEGSRQFWQDQAISELGFIAVTVDGLGMAFRSKWFQDHSYRNLGDAGMPDHIGAL